jgi:hypothetical protein
MTRSYALAFGAVTLRIYLAVFALAGVEFWTGYRIASWLCWVPNLILVEAVLLPGAPFRASRPLASPSRTPG